MVLRYFDVVAVNAAICHVTKDWPEFLGQFITKLNNCVIGLFSAENVKDWRAPRHLPQCDQIRNVR